MAITLRFGEQDAVGHQFQIGVLADVIGKPYLVTYASADIRSQLLGDPRCNASGRNPARLGVANHSRNAATQFQAYFWQLRSLARTGFTADDDHLIFRDGLCNLILLLRDR